MSANYKLQSEVGLIAGAEPIEIITRFEKLNTRIVDHAKTGDFYATRCIVDEMAKAGKEGRPFVLGLSTGKSPIGVYRELVRLHKEEGLSFANVIVFSLDEFYGENLTGTQCRNYVVKEEFLSKVDIKKENINIPDHTVSEEKVSDYCKAYEERIAAAGGIDLMILGIGEQGQIGFNEPGAYENTRTRLVALSNSSRKLASSAFSGIDNTPKEAITMGISTILKTRKILLLAWSESKAGIVAKIIEGRIDPQTPATYLQQHDNVEVIIDEGAASLLTRVQTPWVVGTCDWTPRYIRKAVLWLCQKVGKPILKLRYQDYVDNYLAQLLDVAGSYDQINIKVFNDLQHTISGWPGGKPNADDSTRPERSKPFPKRVLIFSPHPDDDVISMGGTFLRLVDQGHDVHVAYQTSGNIAVHDDVVLQIFDTARECGLEDEYDKFKKIIASKKDGDIEPAELRKAKGAIRRAEAKAACRSIGLNDETNVHFLNLPFYETGAVKKSGLGEQDIQIVIDLLHELKPHQIYAAGDLSDPHGTHRVCIEAVLEALNIVKHEEWIKECRLWLYRGAWQEWELDKVDMAVPLSPDEVIKKRHAIYRHLSQKDIVPFPGDDKREFWQRAEDRTQATAALYDKLGMAEYEAIEVFVNYPIK